VISASQIVTDACAIAKCPGFTQLGGRCLNLVLNDLVLHRDLKMLRKTETINVVVGSNGPFALPADYLRTYDLFYTVNNFPYFLYPMSQEQYDQLFKDPSIANYPYSYATDLSATQTPGSHGSIFIYPQSTSPLGMTHRYMVNMPDLVAPETSSSVPWFPDQDYLVHAVATRLMKTTDDSRLERFIKDGEDMLRTHLIMEGDEQKVVKEVRLDPQRFHLNRSLRPTKLNPY
jgi:hypothetical protein